MAGALALCYLESMPARPSQASGRKMAWEDGAKLGCTLKPSGALAEHGPHKSSQSLDRAGSMLSGAESSSTAALFQSCRKSLADLEGVR